MSGQLFSLMLLLDKSLNHLPVYYQSLREVHIKQKFPSDHCYLMGHMEPFLFIADLEWGAYHSTRATSHFPSPLLSIMHLGSLEDYIIVESDFRFDNNIPVRHISSVILPLH